MNAGNTQSRSRAREPIRQEVTSAKAAVVDSDKPEQDFECFGVNLNNIEMSVFEEWIDGHPQKTIAARLGLARGLVNAMMLEGRPVARAIHAANVELHRRLQRRREVVVLSCYDTLSGIMLDEANTAETRAEVACSLLDRLGHPKQTAAKVEMTGGATVVHVQGTLPDLLAQVRQLEDARARIVEVVAIESTTTEG